MAAIYSTRETLIIISGIPTWLESYERRLPGELILRYGRASIYNLPGENPDRHLGPRIKRQTAVYYWENYFGYRGPMGEVDRRRALEGHDPVEREQTLDRTRAFGISGRREYNPILPERISFAISGRGWVYDKHINTYQSRVETPLSKVASHYVYIPLHFGSYKKIFE